MSLELAKLIKELNSKKENGLKEVNEAVSEERNHLQNEITNLAQTKEGLTKTIEELKKSLNEYNKTITKLNKTQEVVVWEAVKDDDPIYDTSLSNFESYVKGLKLIYQEKTGVSTEECELEFQKYCQAFAGIVEILSWFKEKGYDRTIKDYIDSEYYRLLSEKNAAQSLEGSIKTLRLPTYQPVQDNIDSHSINLDTIPNNMNTMLREMYLQRVALEAVAKQRILEAELKSVIGVLMKVAPTDYNLRSLIETYSGFDNFLPNEINSYLGNNQDTPSK